VRRPRGIVLLWGFAGLFVALCALIALRGDAWLADAPRFDASRGARILQGDRLWDGLPAGSGRWSRIGDHARLYANVDLDFHVETGRVASRSIFVAARGRPLDGVWPMLTLHVDRRYRGAFFVASREWRVYRFDLDLKPGQHRFRLSYVNDRPGFPAKRDVDLRLIGLGDPESLAGLLPAGVGPVVPVGGDPPDAEALARATTDPPLRLTGPLHVVEPGHFDLDSGAGTLDGARVLWSNGSVGRTVVAGEDGEWRLSVQARGERCEGEGPRTLVLIDDDHVATWNVSAERFEDHAARLSLSAGRHEIRLVFDNDRRVPGLCDRNLHVAGLRLERAGEDG
jgi:hypothetical protein